MFCHSLALATKQRTFQQGFSLVELLVSIGILILVLSIVITRQSTFNSAVLLRSQAYEIALDVRDIQLSAVSSVNNAAGGGEDFRSVLGVSFGTAATANDRYTLFVDTDGDGAYAAGTDSIYGSVGLLDPRFEIDAIRYIAGATVNTPAQAAVTFLRPNFDARFNAGSGLVTVGTLEIDIKASASTGTACPEVRTIQITSTGQVTVLEC